ncbi:hypothetical protein FJ250_10520 [bacterium]|nr:hypothetical protein [bacterium]
MNACRRFGFPFLLAALLTLPALADPEPVPTMVRDATGDPPPVAVDGGAAGPAADAAAPATLLAEITALYERGQVRARELEAAFAATADPAAALAIQREIEALQVATELDILRIQAAHARRQGREADAKLLEAAIAEALAPVRPDAPAPRPTPDASTRNGR